MSWMMTTALPDSLGRFGEYGGRYVPEILVAPLDQLEGTYREISKSAVFQSELEDLFLNYAGRPTPLFHAQRLSQHLKGAKNIPQA